MNVMVYNKYKDALQGLNIEVMKSLEGVYNVDEIIDTFTNFYYDKMILDITAIRDYQNIDNLQKLSMNINMENVILLLDDTPESDNKEYLSKLTGLGIYNFTKKPEGINYLLVHPHTYRDVVNINNLSDLEAAAAPAATVVAPPMDSGKSFVNDSAPVEVAPQATNNGKLRIIGFKNVTQHAGATTLIYMLTKMLADRRNVAAIEINKVDFLYFNDPAHMVSSTSQDVLKEIMHKNDCNVIFLDLNDYDDLDICTEVYYLIEPSTIMINRMLKKGRNILETLKGKNVLLNKCVLNSEDVAQFEFETKLKVLFAVPALDDRQNNIEPIKKLLGKINLW